MLRRGKEGGCQSENWSTKPTEPLVRSSVKKLQRSQISKIQHRHKWKQLRGAELDQKPCLKQVMSFFYLCYQKTKCNNLVTLHSLLLAFDSSRQVKWIGPSLTALCCKLNFQDALCTRTLLIKVIKEKCSETFQKPHGQ